MRIESIVRIDNRTEYADRRSCDTCYHSLCASLEVERIAEAAPGRRGGETRRERAGWNPDSRRDLMQIK
jgi:hypothetical protein